MRRSGPYRAVLVAAAEGDVVATVNLGFIAQPLKYSMPLVTGMLERGHISRDVVGAIALTDRGRAIFWGDAAGPMTLRRMA